ncbi:MAG: hypothetical protein ACXWFO_07085, partial [Candidatus Aminicenantales bacterium]
HLNIPGLLTAWNCPHQAQNCPFLSKTNDIRGARTGQELEIQICVKGSEVFLDPAHDEERQDEVLSA